MKRGMGIKKYENCILTLIVMAVNVLLMGILFDFYYGINDDTLMHDIMSGVYSGIPDGHNMQTLYPLGAFIALCYEVCRTFPWYGLFLCLCQFGCFYLIGVRLCSLRDDMEPKDSIRIFAGKILYLLMLSLFQWGVWLVHLVDVTYTITCAMLSAAAIFLFMTTAEGLNTKQFIIKNIPSVLLVILAYMLRSEMLLLTFPFICLAGLYRLSEEKKVLVKENLIRYGSVLGIILIGMLFASLVDYIAYGSPEWKDFRSFFNARTTIYDYYHELIAEDGYSDILAQLGVSKPQMILLRGYNYALDDSINTELLTKLADYATDTLKVSKDWTTITHNMIYTYYYRSTHRDDAPYNVIVFWAYATVAVMEFWILKKRGTQNEEQKLRQKGIYRYAFLWRIVLLALVRSAIWMFILLRGRYPERITHSLYFVEIFLLAAMAVQMRRNFHSDEKTASAGVQCGMAVLFILITAVNLGNSVSDARTDQDTRSQINIGWYSIDAYCREHEENFYFEDIYSVALFSRLMFEKTDNSYANYDYMGGWMCKSPLYYEELQKYDISSVQDALLDQDNVYLIMSDQRVDNPGVDWITDYYESQDIAVKAERTDTIDGGYSVLRIVMQ